MTESARPSPLGGNESLDALVARTAGPQPWRKAFHAFNAVTTATLLLVFEPPRAVAIAVLGALVVASLASDVVRLTVPRAQELFFTAFGKLASPREAKGVASSTWYVLGMLLAVVLFPPAVAITSILVMGLCDPAAAVIGRTFGRRPFLGGTLEGSLAFFAVSAAIVGLRHGLAPAVAVAAVATLVERRSWPLDDNLAVPVASGAVIQAIAWLA